MMFVDCDVTLRVHYFKVSDKSAQSEFVPSSFNGIVYEIITPIRCHYFVIKHIERDCNSLRSLYFQLKSSFGKCVLLTGMYGYDFCPEIPSSYFHRQRFHQIWATWTTHKLFCKIKCILNFMSNLHLLKSLSILFLNPVYLEKKYNVILCISIFFKQNFVTNPFL